MSSPHSGLCEWQSEGEDCERCNKEIPEGNEVYFNHTDFFSMDGEYICSNCWKGNSNA